MSNPYAITTETTVIAGNWPTSTDPTTDPLATAANLNPALVNNEAALETATGLTTQAQVLDLAHAYNYVAGITTNPPDDQIQAALAVHPETDGVDVKLSDILTNAGLGDLIPANFNAAPSALSASDFETWNSALQKEYLHRNGCDYGGSLVIGPSSPANSQITVVLSTKTTGMSEQDVKVIVLNNLTKTSFATMSKADQDLVVAQAYFTNVLGPSFNLTGGTQARNDVVNNVINAAISQIVAQAQKAGASINVDATATDGSFATVTVGSSGATANTNGNGELLTYNDTLVFINEIKLIYNQLTNMSVFSTIDIQNAVNAIKQRFINVSYFGSVPNVTTTGWQTSDSTDSGHGHPTARGYLDSNDEYYNVVSTDPVTSNAGQYSQSAASSQTTIAQSYQKLMNAETQVYNLANQRTLIATTGTLANKQLDVPSLIFYLQLYYNLTDEQENAASTEVVNQQNSLLNAYSAMQNLINNVLAKFTKDPKDNQQMDISGQFNPSDTSNAGIDGDHGAWINDLGFTSSQYATISMFEDILGGSSAKNPIESIYGINRPKLDIYHNGSGIPNYANVYTQSGWNAYATQLSDAVTQINQQTQIVMNNINSLDKQKNQHFDLANNALSKASDLLQAIGRNIN